MAEQTAQGSSYSGSMSAEQNEGTPGQQGGALVPASEVPAPAAGLPRTDLLGIILIVVVVVVVALLAGRRGRRHSR